MKVRYVGDTTRVIDAQGSAPIVCEPGETIEVPSELGKSLIEQSDRFKAGTKTKAAKSGEESESE